MKTCLGAVKDLGTFHAFLCGKGNGYYLESFQTISMAQYDLKQKAQTGTFSLESSSMTSEKRKDTWKESRGVVKEL